MSQNDTVMDDVRFNMRMSRGMSDSLDSICKRTGRGKADVLRELIDEFIMVQKKISRDNGHGLDTYGQEGKDKKLLMEDK